MAAGLANKVVPFVHFTALSPTDSALNAGGAIGEIANVAMLPGAIKQVGKLLIRTVKGLVSLAVRGAKAAARGVADVAATIRESKSLATQARELADAAKRNGQLGGRLGTRGKLDGFAAVGGVAKSKAALAARPDSTAVRDLYLVEARSRTFGARLDVYNRIVSVFGGRAVSQQEIVEALATRTHFVESERETALTSPRSRDSCTWRGSLPALRCCETRSAQFAIDASRIAPHRPVPKEPWNPR